MARCLPLLSAEKLWVAEKSEGNCLSAAYCLFNVGVEEGFC